MTWVCKAAEGIINPGTAPSYTSKLDKVHSWLALLSRVAWQHRGLWQGTDVLLEECQGARLLLGSSSCRCKGWAIAQQGMTREIGALGKKENKQPLVRDGKQHANEAYRWCSIGRSSEPHQSRAIISADSEKLEIREENNKIRPILGKTIWNTKAAGMKSWKQVVMLK